MNQDQLAEKHECFCDLLQEILTFDYKGDETQLFEEVPKNLHSWMCIFEKTKNACSYKFAVEFTELHFPRFLNEFKNLLNLELSTGKQVFELSDFQKGFEDVCNDWNINPENN